MDKVKRIEWIDALRGFACILVIIGHIPFIPGWITKIIYSFHMPLFFFISGYVFNFDKWKNEGLKKLTMSRIKTYILPFVILGIIIISFELIKTLIFSNVIYWDEFYQNTAKYIEWFLFQIDTSFTGGLIGATWFLPTIFISSLLLYFVLKQNNIIKIIYVVLTMLIVKLTCHYSIILPWHIDTAFLGTLFMLCGYYINKFDILHKLDNILIQIPLFIIGNCCVFFNKMVDLNTRMYSNYHLMFFGALFISIFLAWTFMKINIKFNVLKYFGNYSILVMALNYAIHKLLLKVFYLLNYFPNLILFTIIEIVVFYLVIILYGRFEKNNRFLSIICGHK